MNPWTLVCLFFFLSPPEVLILAEQNLTDMLAANPLLARMSMFQDFENTTIALPPEEEIDEEEEFIRKMSTKRSSTRETVSDNFDERYRQMNASLFDEADPESGDLDYRDLDFAETAENRRTSPDDLDLQKAIHDEVTVTATSSFSPTSSPFAASSSLFETPIVSASTDFSTETTETDRGAFSRSSPYFKAFPSTPTSQFVSSSFDPISSTLTFSSSPPSADSFESSEASEAPEAFTLSGEFLPTSSETFESHADDPNSSDAPSRSVVDEDKFFLDPEDSLDVDNDVEDISSVAPEKEDVTTTPTAAGISKATFQGSSWPQLAPLLPQKRRHDENDVVQYNGRYSVSATKYYVDNRVDGEHYETLVPELIEDTIQENTVEEVDPFAVEREMKKAARMHSAKTQSVEDPLDGLEKMMIRDRERRLGDEIPEEESLTMRTDTSGKKFERRKTVYHGKKTTVNLWNRNLYGHDLIRFPGAIFDDRFDEPRRKSDKRRAVASRIVLSSEKEWKNPRPRLRKVVAGVTTSLQKPAEQVYGNEKERKTTEDVESVCFNSKKNTALASTSPFETDENVTKLECLTRCAKSLDCFATTYSVPLATCAMYGQIYELQKSAIRSQGHSLHRKLSKTTLRCVRMFVSKEFFDADAFDEEESEVESSPPFLRLVEKDAIDGVPSVSASLLFAQKPRCPDGQDVIFVRSDDVERGNHAERRDYVEISEDDCVFACLTNTRPGGGTSDCTAIEYDKTRGFCFLMMSRSPGDVAMTPRPVHPVTTYEKICIQQSSANKCSGGQPIRHRQSVLIGHLVDAHSVGSAAECVDLCIEKHTIGCVSVMFYAKETTLNCILNDATNLDDPDSFFIETSTIVDFFSIQDCLGIREVNRRAKKRLFQNRTEQLARLRRKMARM
ncbi:unnamed protein product [Caenorhabditis sp. 36 PRJEB53466]|nr:unnamed protein product [Caenorhabditis sp. 36 PRJEB53466]